MFLFSSPFSLCFYPVTNACLPVADAFMLMLYADFCTTISCPLITADAIFCHLLSEGFTEAWLVGMVRQVLTGYCWQHWYSPVQDQGPDNDSKSRFILYHVCY